MGDLRVAWRVLRKSPSYAVIAVLTLGLAIGGATTIFSVLNAVILRPLPYAQPDRLVAIRDASPPRFPEFSVAPGRFLEWQTRTRAFESVAASQTTTYNLIGVGEPMRLRGAFVTFNMFGLLAVPPLKGRTFTADEDRPGSDREIVLSESLWRDRFGAAEDVIGRTITIDDQPSQIIGVMPRAFVYPNAQTQAWTPMALTDRQRTQYGSHYIAVMARLKPGVTLAAAREDQIRAAREIESIDQSNQNWTSIVLPYLDAQVRDVKAGIWILSVAVAGVLLIACANLANLLLARGVGRQRELGVRAALGATRARLIRQMLVENTVVAVMGSATGVALAWAGLAALTASPTLNLPRAQTIALDLPTLAFAALLAGLTPIVFGLLPALQMSHVDLRALMSQGGRSGASSLRARTRAALIVAEVGLAVMLVVGSALLLQSFARLVAVSPGFETDRQLAVGISLPATRYKDDAHREVFWRSLTETIERLPGVEAAGVSQSVPFFGDHVSGLTIPGRTPTDPNQQPSTNFYAVSPDYFKAMGIPILQGRSLNASDASSSARVAVISQSIAAQYFGNESPLGRQLIVSQGPNRDPAEIVGVAGDIKQYGLDRPTSLQVYQPIAQHPYFSSLTLIVRSAATPEGMTASVRKTLADLDPSLPIFTARTMASAVDASVGPRWLTTTLLGLFAGMALLLAVVGAYGLVSFTVGQRTQEIGLRVALGAPRGRVLGLVFRQGLGLAAAGAVVGTVGAVWAAHLLDSQLFQASSKDTLLAFSVAPLALLASVAVACYIPARRALQVDPVTALRES